ncbi:MAG: FIST signal transduction protein [Solirubrobacterales bacterium]
MSARIAVGVSESFDPVEAFSEAARDAARELDAPCDLCILFAGPTHLGHAKWLLSTVHDELSPTHLIGCGASGVVGGGREIEGGAGAVVWAASLPGVGVQTHHLEASPGKGAVAGLADGLDGDALVLLADPYSFATERLLESVEAIRPGLPVLGGLVSAAAAGGGVLFRNGDVISGGAVACSLDGVAVVPCVSQGAAPVGPEMTVTAAHDNVIEELASMPALERVKEAIAELPERERALAAEGLILGLVIDENQPEYERGDFLVRPIIGADPDHGWIAVGEQVQVGQTVRLQVRDEASADEDLREALRTQSEAHASGGVAGALLFTCNGRGSHMFTLPDHDAVAIEDTLGTPTAGFFCAGEIGPVGGRNFLHGFTATLAVFPAD